MAEVLIDTSAWIQYFRDGNDPASRAVTELVQADRAVLTGPVITELLQGVRHEGEARKLARLLSILPCLDVERSDWRTTGETLYALRRRGITLPLTDALIATVAARHGVEVLTVDPHFRHLPVARTPL